MKPWVLSTLLLFASALPSFAGSPSRSASQARPAPSFTLPAVNGTVVLDSLRGRVVYVDFWASWCEPCKRSFPWLATLQKSYGPRGLTVVAINLDKDRDAAGRFLQKYPAAFTVAFDPAGTIAEAYQVAGMPSSFLIGKDGSIVHSHIGFDAKKTGPIEQLILEACSK